MSEPRSAADEVRAALYGTDALALFEQILTGESGSDVSATKGAPSPPSPRLPQSHGYWNDAEKRWVFPLHPIDPDQPAVLLRDTPEDVERLRSIIKDYSGLEDDQVADTTDYIIEWLRGEEGT